MYRAFKNEERIKVQGLANTMRLHLTISIAQCSVYLLIAQALWAHTFVDKATALAFGLGIIFVDHAIMWFSIQPFLKIIFPSPERDQSNDTPGTS